MIYAPIALRRNSCGAVRRSGATISPISMIIDNCLWPRRESARHVYDEMLVDGDRVAVVGYSYARGGTEVGLFRLDENGGLRYEATYELRSNNYYSTRNCASRLVDHQLTFYAPLYLWGDPSRVLAMPVAEQWPLRSRDA